MAIFRQYIAPLLIVLVFLFALVAVGARSFLPNDMAEPAPIESEPPQVKGEQGGIELVKGLPQDPGLSSELPKNVN